MTGFVEGAAPLCVFCSKPWSDEMIALLDVSVHDEGYYPGDQDYAVTATIDITCDGCNRLIYRKDIRKEDC